VIRPGDLMVTPDNGFRHVRSPLEALSEVMQAAGLNRGATVNRG